MEFDGFMYNFFNYSGNVAVFVLGLSVLLCALHFNKLKIPFQRLFYFLIWNLVIELLARVFMYLGINNLPLLHLYTIGEFILFSWFYKSLITKPFSLSRKFGPFIVIGAILIAVNSILFQGIYDYNPITKTIVQIIIISYAVLYFYNLTENHSESKAIGKSLSLINSAILIYYSGSLFIFMTSQMLKIYPEWKAIFWAFNAVLNIIFQLIILWGIWIVIFKKTPSSS